jgi:hypothetical protein
MAIFPDIATSRLFTANSLSLIICPIHKWRLFLKIFKSNLSSFSLYKTRHSLLYLSVLFVSFFSSAMFQIHLRSSLHFLLRSTFLIHNQQHSKYVQLSIRFFFLSKLRLSKISSFFLLLNITCSFFNSFYFVFFTFPTDCCICPSLFN